MLSELMAAASSVKTIKEMLKTALDAKTYEAVNAVLIKATDDLIAAQNLILKLQTEQTSLMRENSLLQQEHAESVKEIARLVEWRVQGEQYTLAEVASGAFAYVVKPVDPHTAPAVNANTWLCCQCYEAGYKSIFQFAQWHSHDHRQFVCQRCKSALIVYTPSDGPAVMTIGSSRRGFDDY